MCCKHAEVHANVVLTVPAATGHAVTDTYIPAETGLASLFCTASKMQHICGSILTLAVLLTPSLGDLLAESCLIRRKLSFTHYRVLITGQETAMCCNMHSLVMLPSQRR